MAFQADAVMPAARRSGMSTPCAPNPAAERTTAPRLRGSVTESSATISGFSPISVGPHQQVVGVGVLVRRQPCGQPWCTAPVVIRSSSLRVTSIKEMPFSAANLKASRRRPSRSAPSATYTPMTGMSSRSTSTTELRPATHSASVDFRRRCGFLLAARSSLARTLWVL